MTVMPERPQNDFMVAYNMHQPVQIEAMAVCRSMRADCPMKTRALPMPPTPVYIDILCIYMYRYSGCMFCVCICVCIDSYSKSVY